MLNPVDKIKRINTHERKYKTMNKYTLEKHIEQYLFKRCRTLGGMAVKLLSVNTGGIPDRLVLLPGGVILFVELKRQGEEPRPLQKYQHRKLKDLGFRVEVIDSKERVEEVLAKYDLQTPRLSADG